MEQPLEVAHIERGKRSASDWFVGRATKLSDEPELLATKAKQLGRPPVTTSGLTYSE